MRNLICCCAALACWVDASAGELPSVTHSRPVANAEASAQWTVRGQVPPEEFVIQCHRGAGELAPENTLEAFELGWRLGAVPEADLRTTKDGVIVAFHDNNFKRTVKDAPAALQDKGIAEVTFSELSRLEVGGWKGAQFVGRRVPRMSEVFELMRDQPKRRLYLDIKNVDLKHLAAEVRRSKVGGQVILASTVYEVIRQWKALVPESKTLLWMGGTEAALEKRLVELRLPQFAGIDQLQVHVRPNPVSDAEEPFALSRSFLRSVGAELRSHGIVYQTLPWGMTQAKVYGELLDLGVASFATDHPEVTIQAVRDYYRQPATGGTPQ